MINHAPRSINRRSFLGQTATLAAAGIGASLPTRVLAAEKEDAAKALGLKITALKTFVVDTGPDSDENYVFVKIYTNKDIVGLGEGTMTGKCKTVATAIEEHERYLIGKDPTDIEYLWQAMFRGSGSPSPSQSKEYASLCSRASILSVVHGPEGSDGIGRKNSPSIAESR